MNAEQIDTLLNFIQDTASGVDYFDFEARKAAAQLKSDLAAMQAPITAEALLADGWEETWRTEQYGGIIEFSPGQAHYNSPLFFWDVETTLDGTLRRVVDSRNSTVKNAKSMYDLAELVRLLGGVQ